MIKLIIFDYDGLLVESEIIAFLAEEKILKQHGKILTKKLFNNYLGYSVRETIQGYIKYYDLSINLNEFILQRDEVINSLLSSHLSLKPGAKLLLNYLKDKNISMAIGSSGKRSYIEKGLAILGISDYFNNITSIDEVVRGKPHPDIFLKVLNKNHVESRDAIVLEDAVSGIQAAQDAHIFCIAIASSSIDIQEYRIADLIVDNLQKVKELLDQLQIIKKY
ncbi:MAG TPA: HAD family phosphatase [Candidatus Woesebacteria bacterium]|nr:HAD family phosphatase [Candidatus Woesebacteria bacterium]